MKKVISFVAIAVLLGTAPPVFAQSEKEGMDKGMMMEKGRMGKGMMMGEGMMGKGMMGEGMMGKGMMGQMHGMMMHSMMNKSMLATSDGGVIVLSGNKLIKYDKDLNMVKEVELKSDTEAMEKMMKDMMDKCPMMKGMMGEGMKDNVSADKKSAEEEQKAHESHH